MLESGLAHERAEALRVYREYEAIYTLVNAMTVTIRNEFNATKESLGRIGKSELRRFKREAKQTLADLRRDYGVKVASSELLEVFSEIEQCPEGQLPRINKGWLADMFSHYDRALPNFNSLPTHALIEIDPGRYRQSQGKVTWYWLEATVFEDMCALFNLAKKYQIQIDQGKKSNELYKSCYALCRATIISGFHFVEAYLNGLAYDYCISNWDTLEGTKRSDLMEWDYTKNKAHTLPLREKALKYPRIILQTDHPPLEERNCPELEYIVRKAKFIRDAIIHVSPTRDPRFIDTSKETLFYDTPFEDVESTVDKSIVLVRKIEKLIYGDDKRLFWLIDRGNDGFFPVSVYA